MCLSELLAAMDAEEVDRVTAMLTGQPALARVEVGVENGHVQTLLHRAIPPDGEKLTRQKERIIEALLEHGAEVDAPGWGANNGLCTPLTLAAWGGHERLVVLLTGKGADPNGLPEQAARCNRPIDTAARHGHTAAVEALIKAGADFSLRELVLAGLTSRVAEALEHDSSAASRPGAGGDLPVLLAVHAPEPIPMIRLLLNHGAALDSRDSLGRTALHIALENCSSGAVEYLVGLGAPQDIYTLIGLGRSDEAAAVLAASPSLCASKQPDGTTPLFYAALAGDERTAEALIAGGAEASPRSPRFWACLTPLHVAIQNGRDEIVRLLLRSGADCDACAFEPDRYWPSPLHAAARCGSLDDVRLLLDSGAAANCRALQPDQLWLSGLGWAVFAGRSDLVRLLLEYGLDLSEPCNREALHLAAERGHCKLAKLLAGHGADVCAEDTAGQTPLDRAERFAQAETSTWLRSVQAS